MFRTNIAAISMAIASVLCLPACKKSPSQETGPQKTAEKSEEQTPEASAPKKEYKPFPSTPIEASPLHDQSRDIKEILENGTLSAEDCKKWKAGAKDRETTLRCGKWMYFFENLEVPGAPAKIVDLIRENAPTSAGKSLEKFGLFPNPYSKINLPVGMTDGPDMTGNVKTYTFTCSSCHFGKTNDGRYVVGSPNHSFDFGKLTLTIATIPELALPTKKQPDEVMKILNPIKEEMFDKGANRLAIISEAIKLLPSVIVTKVGPPNDAAKVALAISPSGVMDPYAAPSLDDGAAISVRMSPLWGIDPKAMTAAGSTHGAMLGSNGGAPDLEHIMRTSATISGKIRAMDIGGKYNPESIKPLVEYVMSLKPPKSEKTFDAKKLDEAEQIFGKNCYRCHNGPGYAGTRIFQLEEIGTDPNLRGLVDPMNTGKAIFDVLTPEELTKGIRARRLSGVSSMSRLFHNGNSRSLADVFCLNGPRQVYTQGPGHSAEGHAFTCELKDEEKEKLIYFLESL